MQIQLFATKSDLLPRIKVIESQKELHYARSVEKSDEILFYDSIKTFEGLGINKLGKATSGILSLYGLVGFMGDILSYSRLLALGLATAIIGLAVNTVAALVGGIPYIGWLIMAVVFIGGHIFNLLINALGSFIHSGRLQFVEFFTKFMEGGGQAFKPFSKKTKYVYIKK